MTLPPLQLRKIPLRTLAWLGDAEYERFIRWSIARSGPWKSQELERVRVRLARAETQAEFLLSIQEQLLPCETDLIRRAKNLSLPSPRGAKSTKTYRMATALEALIAFWILDDSRSDDRFTTLLTPLIESTIANAFSRIPSSKT